MLHDSASKLEILQDAIEVIIELLDSPSLAVGVPVLMILLVRVVLVLVLVRLGVDARLGS